MADEAERELTEDEHLERALRGVTRMVVRRAVSTRTPIIIMKDDEIVAIPHDQAAEYFNVDLDAEDPLDALHFRMM